MRIRKRKPLRIDSGAMYDAEGLRASAGIGRDVLRELRERAGLECYMVGKRLMYSGAEVIAAIRACGARETNQDAAPQDAA
jgi:hypothetical protein